MSSLNTSFGSTLYFSTAGLSHEAKEAIQLIWEIAQTLYDIAERYREPEIARVKLLWWREEIELLFQSKPRHPLTQGIQNFCSVFGLTLAQFEALVQGVQNSLVTESYETQTDLEQHFSHTGGIVLLMMAQICKYPLHLTGLEEAQLIRAGVGLEIIRHMVDFPFLVQRGHFPLPLKELDALKITPLEAIEKQHQQQLQQLLLKQAERSKALVSEVLSTTASDLRPVRRYICLQLALLDQIVQDDCQVLVHRWSLGLLKKWWISWRTS